jgi:hypothetical protein
MGGRDEFWVVVVNVVRDASQRGRTQGLAWQMEGHLRGAPRLCWTMLDSATCFHGTLNAVADTSRIDADCRQTSVFAGHELPFAGLPSRVRQGRCGSIPHISIGEAP